MAKMTSLATKWSDYDKPMSAKDDTYYPSIGLNDKQLDGAGLDKARVGDEFVMTAKVRVSSLSEHKAGSKNISLDVCEASFSAAVEEPDKASVLYPEEK